ncbi:MAG: hypothetical protein JXB30_10635 [Anaerolineae bacterium]|nr:hypothetical protein [Anaerolineae bacterium]
MSSKLLKMRCAALVVLFVLVVTLFGCAQINGETPTPTTADETREDAVQESTATPVPTAEEEPGSDGAITPFVECIVDIGYDRYIAFFGYENTYEGSSEFALGPDNFLSPEPSDPEQLPPETFRPKGSLDYPDVVFGVEFDGSDLTWTVDGNATVANRDSEPCPLETTPVEVNPSEAYQTIHGWGGAFVHDSSKSLVEGPYDEVARYNLEHFDVTHFRVRMTLRDWEPVNDDGDPNHYEWSNFAITDGSERVFQFMQDVSAEEDVEVIASIWTVPDWMVVDPTLSDGQLLHSELYDEVIESMTSWLLYARDEYGVEVDYVSFNEPNLGIAVSVSSEDYARLAIMGGSRFAREGLKTRWVFGEANNMGSALYYSERVWEVVEARPYLGPFVFHGWDADLNDRTIKRIRTWAMENQFETWVTETGYDPELWRRPDEFKTWENAIWLARLYSRIYKLSGANVLFYWQMMDDYPLVSADGKQPYPAFYVMDQFEEQFPAGSVIVGTSENTETIYSVAAQAETHFVLHLVNTARVPEQIEVTGLPAGTYYYVNSRSGSLLEHIDTLDIGEGEAISLVLPNFSVAALTTLPPQE